jgi:signal transduction histidine kinase
MTTEAARPASSRATTTRHKLPRLNAEAARSLWRVNRVYWLVVLYSGVWILLRAQGIGGPPFGPISHVAIAGIFALAIVNLSLRTRSAAQRGGYGRAHPSRIGWAFTALDLAMAATALRLTGGLNSGLWPILFLVAVAETVLEPTRESWFVRGGIALALVTACVPIPFKAGPWILDVATRTVFLTAVASVARRLRENSDREKAEIASLRAELSLTEERSHLSREIHDGVGNSLAAAVLRLEVAARLVEKSALEETPATLLREEAAALRQAMGSVRDWTYWTRSWPVAESAAGARPSDLLTGEVERLSRRVSLPIELSGAELLDEVGPRMTLRLAVLRIAQEALTNVAKHARGATHAKLSLRRDGAVLALTIADDGAGFSSANQAQPDTERSPGCGVGIAGMRERAQSVGGSLTVSGHAGGAVVVARLPFT